MLVTPEHARAALDSRTAGTVLVHPDPLAGLQALARAWVRELRARGTRVVGVTGSTGKTSTKDILAAILQRAPDGREPRELQHGDRAAADRARRADRHRGAGARDGDARSGTDRRADGDRGARRGRDRERRPRTPRAARHARGDRGRQGGAHRRPGDRARPPWCPRASSCWLLTCARTSVPSRSATAGILELEAGRSPRRRWRSREGSAAASPWSRPSARRTNSANLLAAVAAARRSGRHSAGAAWRCRFSSLRGERLGLAGRRGPDQRLLQRQPDVHARGDRRPGGVGARAARGGAR